MKIELLPVDQAEAEMPGRASLMMPKDAQPGPLVTGDGSVDYLCSNCGLTLAKGLEDASQIQGVQLKCPRCNGWNRSRN